MVFQAQKLCWMNDFREQARSYTPPKFLIHCQFPLAADLLRHCIVIFLSYRIARVCA